MTRKPAISVAALLAVLLLSEVAQATIYTFVDARGTVHFTNVPNDPRYQKGIVVPASLRMAARRPAPRSSVGADPRLFEEYILQAANRYAVDPQLVKAVIRVESNFDHRAVSSKGAMGLMQLMPGTASDLNVCDPFDPEANIHGGTCYLRQMLDRFGGDIRLALAAYNAGPGRVEEAMGIPMIPETQQYVGRVLQHYRQMAGGYATGRWASSAY
ncbi:MAG: transglycosylase SLT domain-containing protein [Thermodesulfobacteriota bacterium]